MKKWAVGLYFLLGSVAVVAQGFPGMSEADMQNFQQQMQKMQACMADVDQAELQALQQRGKALQAEVQQLCASGKRDRAQQRAMKGGLEIASDPTIKKLRECSGMMPSMAKMMPKIPYAESPTDKEDSSGHICD